MALNGVSKVTDYFTKLKIGFYFSPEMFESYEDS